MFLTSSESFNMGSIFVKTADCGLQHCNLIKALVQHRPFFPKYYFKGSKFLENIFKRNCGEASLQQIYILYTLKLVSTIFIKFLFFHQMTALQKLRKMLFISSKKLFSFSRYSNFCISILPFFSTCRPLLWRMIEDKS